MELGQGGHVVHPLLIHGVHRRHLLVGDCALLVGEHLPIVGLEDHNAFCAGIYSTWKVLAIFSQPDPCSLREEAVHCFGARTFFSGGAAAVARKSAQRGGRSREATRVTARLGATPARGAAALPSPGRRCSSAPFVRLLDLLRPNRSLCLFFLQVPHFWPKCSRAENSCWHILPGLGEGGQGLATRLPPSALRRGRSVRAGDCGSPARQQR